MAFDNIRSCNQLFRRLYVVSWHYAIIAGTIIDWNSYKKLFNNEWSMDDKMKKKE